VLLALTRAVSPTLAECELTHLERQPIDVEAAARQHAGYEAALEALGVEVVRVPPAPDLPDAVFVEDTAVVLDEVAVMALPGAPSRRAETPAVAETLSAYRPLLHLTPPATLDGGDVLVVGRTAYIGLSTRTNREAADQLTSKLTPMGYRVSAVEFQGCLHLKSAVTRIDEDLLLLNPKWVSRDAFQGLKALSIAADEPLAANALWCGGSIVYPAQFPRTAERLSRRGINVVPLDCSELAKAEGGVTCCSILFSVPGEHPSGANREQSP